MFYLKLSKDFQLGLNLDFEKVADGPEFYGYCGSSFVLPWQCASNHYPVEKYK